MRRLVGRKGAEARDFAKVCASIDAFKPASQVLREVAAVPTRFPAVDRACETFGLPLERFMLVHGPSNQGKTYFTLGLLESFVRARHLGLFIDAERTTTTSARWVRAVMGPSADAPNFWADRPRTYEATVASVRKWLLQVCKAKKAGDLRPDTGGLIVLDSIRKLVPAGILDKILKGTAKGVDGIGGRAAQIKAAMNAAWLDELVPMLEDAQVGMIAVARETADPETWDGFKVGGGSALYYDSSLVFRVARDSFVYEKARSALAEGEKNRIFGELIGVSVRKTKMADRSEDRFARGFFNISNGALVPAGLDLPRDLVDLGSQLGVVKQAGSWSSWGGVRAQGRHGLVRRLHGDAAKIAALHDAVRLAVAREAA